MSSMVHKDDLIDALRDLADKVGGRPTRDEMNEYGRYSSQPYYTEFGSWSAALEAAGFGTPENQRIPDDVLKAELQRVAQKVGRAPTFEDMQQHGKYNPKTLTRRFGSWLEAREAAGLSGKTQAYGRRADTSVMLAELRTFASAVGRPPTSKELDAFATYGAQTYHRHFDGLFDAFDAAGIAYREHDRPENGVEYYGPEWQSVAEQVRERDGQQCVVCGMTDREHRQEHAQRLHVHHIDKPIDADEILDEIDESRLVTLCRPCHAKWERSPNDPREWL